MTMIDRLISISLEKRVLVLFGVIVLVALGVQSFVRLPIDAFPDVTNIQVEVLSNAPGLSPLDRTMGAIQVAVRQGREQDLFRGESGATKGCSFVCHMSRSGAGRPVRSQHFMPPPWSKST